MAEMFAQVLTWAKADAYRGNRPAAGIDPRRVSGFVVRLGDLAGLDARGVLALVRATHPDVSGEPARYEDAPLALLVFGAGADVRGCLASSAATEVGGTLASDQFAAPWTGNGLLVGPDQRLATEHLVNGSALLPVGSELWAVEGGDSRVVARLGVAPDGSPQWRADDGAGAVALRQDGEHQLFAEIAGRRVPAFGVGDDAIGVLAPDSRAAWLCHPAAAEYTDTPLGCLAIYPLETVDAIWRAETFAEWHGQQLVVEEFTGPTVRVLHVGRPLPGMAEAGFVGDQYHGFRAELPRSEIGRLDPQVGGYRPGRRPARTDAAAPFLPGENRRYHTDFTVGESVAPVPCWWAPDASGTSRPVLRAPDLRAALVMYPEYPERWQDADGGVLVPLPEGAPVARAATSVTTATPPPYVVEGADGESLVARREGSPSDSPPERISPAALGTREDALFLPQTAS